MSLDVLEWGVILVMGAGILVYGPEKIPDMAKTLAQAKKQFDGATKQLQGITKELQTGMNSGNLNIDTISNALLGSAAAGGIPGNPSPAEIAKATAGSPIPSAAAPAGPIIPSSVVTNAPPGPAKTADQMLIEMAKSLRIGLTGDNGQGRYQALADRGRPDRARSPAGDRALSRDRGPERRWDTADRAQYRSSCDHVAPRRVESLRSDCSSSLDSVPKITARPYRPTR
jgi:Sec-independent protein translocase protein TatA